jgi:membrane-bound lytic murein transglycosylase D
VDELIALNPSLLRMVTPPDTEFDLHLPGGTASLFQEKIAAIPESKRNSWRYHKVTPDDTLASIARTYRVSVSDLAGANDLSPTAKLDGLEAVVVPVAPAAAPSAHTLYYTTRRGDTLVSVADRFGISLSQLRRWNKLPATGIKIPVGHRLHVAEPTLVRASTTRRGKSKSNRTRELASAESPSRQETRPRSSSGSSSSKGSHSGKTSRSTSSKGNHAAHSSRSTSRTRSSAHGRK